MDHDQLFRWIMLAGAALIIPFMAYHRFRAHVKGEKLDRRQEGLFILLTLRPIAAPAAAFGLFAYLINPRWMEWSSLQLPTWLRWVGVAFGALAAGLLYWTMPRLGRNLTDTVVTRKSHTLVTTGPYRFVRHPFYVAIALCVLANSLTAANWFIFLTGSLVFILLAIRSRKEEENLAARFGDQYRAYMERTGRFIPRLARPAPKA